MISILTIIRRKLFHQCSIEILLGSAFADSSYEVVIMDLEFTNLVDEECAAWSFP